MGKRGKDGIEVEHTEHGMVIHLPDFTSLRMKETAEFRTEVKKREPGDPSPCGHWRRGVVVDEDKRQVLCRACSTVLDPFDAFLELTKGYDRTRDDFTAARTEIRDMHVRIEVLKRLEKNARDRLKRLGIARVNDDFYVRNLTEILKRLVLDVQRDQREAAKGASA